MVIFHSYVSLPEGTIFSNHFQLRSNDVTLLMLRGLQTIKNPNGLSHRRNLGMGHGTLVPNVNPNS